MSQLHSIACTASPTQGSLGADEELLEVVPRVVLPQRAQQVQHRAVAAQLDPFEKQALKPGDRFIGSRVESPNQAPFKRYGPQLHSSTCTASHRAVRQHHLQAQHRAVQRPVPQQPQPLREARANKRQCQKCQ
jgi:hypothetical protein